MTTPSCTTNEAVLIQRNNALFNEKHERSQNEQILYDEWQKLFYASQQQTNVINELRDEITELKTKLMQTTQKASNAPDFKRSMEYCTDEEELEKETSNDNRYNNGTTKKRKLNTSLTPTQLRQTASDKPEPIERKIEKKEPIPPPITVSNVKNFNVLRSEVLNVSQNEVNFKAISNGDLKITVQNSEDYRSIKKLLDCMKKGTADNTQNALHKIEYHTYQIKSERWYRFVIRGLPPSTNEGDIKNELENKGHEVASVVNIMKKTTKNGEKTVKRFPLFYVDMLPKENNKQVFGIKYLLQCKVAIEQPRKITGIPQCTNCQQLGHTRNFCNRNPRCVKCAGEHHTRECKKQLSDKPICALCGQEGHPANYKGCQIYQKRVKAQETKRKTVVQRMQEKPSTPAEKVTAEKTYAQVVKATNNNQKQPNPQKTKSDTFIYDIKEMISNFQIEIKQNLSQISKRMEQLEIEAKPSKKQDRKNKK